MKVTAERLPESQVLLTIEAEPAEWEAARNRALKELSGKVNIPGFRRGKTPLQLVERFLGRETVLKEVADDLVPELYERAIQQNGLEPVDQPQLEVVSTEPLTVKATVPIKPTVTLGDYSKIEVEEEKLEVPELEVVRGVEAVRVRQAPWQPFGNRPAHYGDTVTLKIEARENGAVLLDEEAWEYLLLPDNVAPVPGFARQIEGLLPGASKDFSLAFPANDPRKQLAGKTFTFSVTIVEAKEKALPALDDEFAKAAGFDSLAALREKVTADVRSQVDAAAKARFEEKVVDALVAQARIEYPLAMVEREIDRMLQDQADELRRGRLNLDDYLKSMKKTVDQYRADLRAPAELRLKRSLALAKVTEAEGVKVGPEEVDAEVRYWSERAGEQLAEVGNVFDRPEFRDTLERRLAVRKTVDLLVAKVRSRRQQVAPSGLVLPGGVQLPTAEKGG
ncbi:MAG: trigger factor [Chloroflexi bacterium]|nr:trigger factor [Chloroflexota bacterium]